MHPNAERVQAALTACGCAGQVVELAASTRTAAEAAAALGTSIAQIAKSLVFMAGDEPVLVIASGANRASVAKLEQRLGRPVRRATADEVKVTTGFPIGGTPPIAHARPLRTLLDRDLDRLATLWAAAGTPHAVFQTAPDELRRLTGGEVLDLAEEPRAAAG
jgi:prolyl-tRNA editing enzyme YbaK/EbsC (Cys-tRNA(Pro) deacylase)